MKLVTETAISDADLQRAIEIRVDRCFPAMNICNALAGTPTIAWQIIRQFTALQLFDEAIARGLPIESWRGRVEGNALVDSLVWKSYRKIKEEEKP